MLNRLARFLVLGYSLMGRSFAYLGVPQLKLFVGELALVGFLVGRPSGPLVLLLSSLVDRRPLSRVSWLLVVSLVYGLFQIARGLYLGYPVVTALQNLVFNYYPLYLFLGLWVGARDAHLLRQVLYPLAWLNALYGLAFVAFLSESSLTIPGSLGVPVLGQPGGSAMAIIGLLCVERNLKKTVVPITLNAMVLLGLQVRAEWLGFALAICVWAVLAKRVRQMIVVLGIVALMLSVAVAVDFSLPSPRGRGGEISARDFAARVVAPFDRASAEEISEFGGRYAGTLAWRTEWWQAIWVAVHREPVTAALGFGYGYPLADLVTYISGQEIRTPHNVLLYALAYTGWIGLALFGLFQFSLVHSLWRSYRQDGQPFGLSYWALIISKAMFGNVFESPFGAIPFYILVGASMASLLNPRVANKQENRMRSSGNVSHIEGSVAEVPSMYSPYMAEAESPGAVRE